MKTKIIPFPYKRPQSGEYDPMSADDYKEAWLALVTLIRRQAAMGCTVSKKLAAAAMAIENFWTGEK